MTSTLVLDVLLVVLALSLLPAVWRMLVGPTPSDRAMAADHGFFVLVAALALLAVRLPTPALLDVVLVATLVGFLATVTLARLVDRRRS
ncbi:monovalent cation/H+ antiporter complex subunit F [Aquipuribacter sp. SD81]|uniref:monovalent cation/H+ antiporter complex subunit F n=1 Tax=Aquipuribacter sp. SD81 TaxID=3127703 RepID=UPI003019C8B3